MDSIYVLESHYGSEGVFTSEKELKDFANSLEQDDLMLHCTIFKYEANSTCRTISKTLKDFRTKEEQR